MPSRNTFLKCFSVSWGILFGIQEENISVFLMKQSIWVYLYVLGHYQSLQKSDLILELYIYYIFSFCPLCFVVLFSNLILNTCANTLKHTHISTCVTWQLIVGAILLTGRFHSLTCRKLKFSSAFSVILFFLHHFYSLD